MDPWIETSPPSHKVSAHAHAADKLPRALESRAVPKESDLVWSRYSSALLPSPFQEGDLDPCPFSSILALTGKPHQ